MSDDHAPPDSVGTRYAVTLGAQVFRLLLSVVSALIVPRTLGPALYGNYNFLLSTAATLRALVDTGSQQAFFTFSSQQRASGPLTKLYAWVLGAQLLFVLAIVGVAVAAGKTEWLWQGQRLDQIVWVTVLDWVIFLALSLQQLGDSKGLTVYSQLIGAAVSAFTIVVLLLLWWAKALTFYSFVWLNLASSGCTCALLVYWLLWKNRGLFWTGTLAVRAYARRWWEFARPLVLLQYYMPVVGYLGLYLVQRWSGSAQLGYYALALQWSSLAMVFTNAAVSIFWRELAHHNAARNTQLAAGTYERFSRLLFFLALVLACWLCASSTVLVDTIAGPQFAPAARVVAVMAFYPAAQTIGQLTTAALKATERTASYARWTVILSVPDLLLTYFLLAPAAAGVPGLSLGAFGMAIKIAIYGLISVQVFDWLNCQALGISFAGVLRKRLAAIGTIGSIAFALLYLGAFWLQSLGLGNLWILGITSCAYGSAILILLWQRPQLAGLSGEQMTRALRLATGRSAV